MWNLYPSWDGQIQDVTPKLWRVIASEAPASGLVGRNSLWRFVIVLVSNHTHRTNQSSHG
jgi:hypothetical protein